MSRNAIYPGSFDPFTDGHMDILRRALHIFGTVHVIVAQNPDKPNSMFTVAERIAMIHCSVNELTEHLKLGVVIGTTDDLISHYAANNNIWHIIRGFRNNSDLEKETVLAKYNQLASDLETVYFHSPDKYATTSSTLVRMLISTGLHEQAIGFMPYGCRTPEIGDLFKKKAKVEHRGKPRWDKK
jgi:pantetheine-phosphate adenylyltransferase